MHCRTVLAFAVLVAACGDNRSLAPDVTTDAPPALWPGATLGGAGDDDVMDIAIVGDTIIVAGYRDGVLGQANVEPVGDAVGFVTVYDAFGTVLHEQLFDTPPADTVDAIAASSAQILVTGRTRGAFPGATNAGSTDMFLAAYTPGVAPTIAQLGDARPQHPVAVARDHAGGIVAAGYDDVYVEGTAVIDVENPITARLRPGFVPEWFRRTDSVVSDSYHAMIAPGPDGEMIVGGQYASGPREGAFVRRLAGDGSEQWFTQIDRVGFDAVTAMTFTHDGRLFAAGATFLTLGATSYGEQDIFVVELDPDTGTILLAMQTGTESSEWARDIVIAADGTIYVVGETLGSLPGATNAGDYDLAILRFAPDGTWTGAWQRGTPGDETVRAVALASDALYIGGYQPGARQDGFVARVPFADLSAR